MNIRTALPKDAADIAAIWNHYIRRTSVTFTCIEKSLASIEGLTNDRLGAGLPFLVAEHKGDVLGFATYGPFRTGPGYAHTAEHSIMLSESARGAGIGRALMAELEAAAKRNAIHCLVAGISAENPAAIAFHEQIGFKKVGHISQAGRKFDRWIDLILLQKMLDCRTDKPDQSR